MSNRKEDWMRTSEPVDGLLSVMVVTETATMEVLKVLLLNRHIMIT